jgi:hypothetical protein
MSEPLHSARGQRNVVTDRFFEIAQRLAGEE